jgi:GNAT superfamily N-acetyltransferase
MTTIRPIEPGDEPYWRLLWRDYLDFYETELPPMVYATSFARLTDPSQRDYNGLLALHDDAPVGLAHYIFHRHGWHIADVCYLQDLYVAPDARGANVGRRLIEAVYVEADAAGAADVYWLTQEFNVTARHLYDRIGRVTPFVKYVR